MSWLNMSALSNPNSLHVSLTSPLVSSSASSSNSSPSSGHSFYALVSSSSTHCFLDSDFVWSNLISTSPISPVELHLFDGSSSSYITELAHIPVTFPSGEFIWLDTYVTWLNLSCSMLLGHN